MAGTIALFTPLDESTVNPDDGENEEAGTVIGNARLLEDMASMRDWSPEPQLWKRRIDWATHICDASPPSPSFRDRGISKFRIEY